MATTFFDAGRRAGCNLRLRRRRRKEKRRLRCLLLLSPVQAWTIIITKVRQLYISARAAAKEDFSRRTVRRAILWTSSGGAEGVRRGSRSVPGVSSGGGRGGLSPEEQSGQREDGGRPGARVTATPKPSGPLPDDQDQHGTSFAAVKVVMEEAASAEAMSLEKGMIVLSSRRWRAGPFIGLLGTVWSVMSTFAGIAVAQRGQLDRHGPRRGAKPPSWRRSPGCWWPSRRCSATTSW